MRKRANIYRAKGKLVTEPAIIQFRTLIVRTQILTDESRVLFFCNMAFLQVVARWQLSNSTWKRGKQTFEHENETEIELLSIFKLGGTSLLVDLLRYTEESSSFNHPSGEYFIPIRRCRRLSFSY